MNSKYGIDDVGCEFFGERAVQLCAKRCSSNGKKELAVNCPFDLEFVEKLFTASISVAQTTGMSIFLTFRASSFAIS